MTGKREKCGVSGYAFVSPPAALTSDELFHWLALNLNPKVIFLPGLCDIQPKETLETPARGGAAHPPARTAARLGRVQGAAPRS